MIAAWNRKKVHTYFDNLCSWNTSSPPVRSHPHYRSAPSLLAVTIVLMIICKYLYAQKFRDPTLCCFYFAGEDEDFVSFILCTAIVDICWDCRDRRSRNCGFCSNRILHSFVCVCVCQSVTGVTSQVFSII